MCHDENLFHLGACDPNPCNNGGTCYGHHDKPGYYCVCPSEYIGEHCGQRKYQIYSQTHTTYRNAKQFL